MINRIATPHSYSSAVVAGDYVFIGLHRGHGKSFAQQLHNIFTELQETLQKCETALENVVKVNVYLKNISDLPEMEKVFFDYFKIDKFPARMTSTTEFIDTDCLVMIDGTAYKPSSTKK